MSGPTRHSFQLHRSDDDTDGSAIPAGKVPKTDGAHGWTYADASVIALDDLTDVIITSPAIGDRFTFNGTDWVNGPGVVVNVLDYGAVEDFSTDNATAFAAAVAAMVPGCTLLFPSVTGLGYKTSATIAIVQRGCLITGTGSEYGTRIHMTTSNTTLLSIIPTALDGTRNQTNLVRSLLLTGPGSASSGRGVYCASDMHLENVGVAGFYDGIHFGNTSFYSRAFGCFVTDCDRAGIYCDSTNNITIDTCRVTGLFPGGSGLIGTLATGIILTAGIAQRIVNCSIEYFTNFGIDAQSSISTAITIAGNYFETQQSSTGFAHIRINGFAAQIDGNYLQGDGTAGFYAILVDQIDHLTISNNRMGINAPIDVANTGYGANVLLFNNYNPGGTYTLPTANYTLDPASPPLNNPMTTAGDIIKGGTAGAAARLGIGSSGNVLTVSGGVPVWAAPAAPAGSAGGDLSGTYPNPTVAKVNGVTVTGTPSLGQELVATSSSAASWQTPAGSGTGPILISDTPAGSPLVFGDLIQNEAGTDLVYADT